MAGVHFLRLWCAGAVCKIHEVRREAVLMDNAGHECVGRSFSDVVQNLPCTFFFNMYVCVCA